LFIAAAGIVNYDRLALEWYSTAQTHFLKILPISMGVTFDTISHLLMGKLEREDIDVIILGSAHLSFVQNYLSSLFSRVKFVDPSRIVAKDVKKFLFHNRMLKRSGVGRLQLIASGDRKDHFDETIRLMGFREAIKRVNP
jgi:glutamate racemase